MKERIIKYLSIQFWGQVFQAFLSTCQRFPLAIFGLIVFTLLAFIENHDLDLLVSLRQRPLI